MTSEQRKGNKDRKWGDKNTILFVVIYRRNRVHNGHGRDPDRSQTLPGDARRWPEMMARRLEGHSGCEHEIWGQMWKWPRLQPKMTRFRWKNFFLTRQSLSPSQSRLWVPTKWSFTNFSDGVIFQTLTVKLFPSPSYFKGLVFTKMGKICDN